MSIVNPRASALFTVSLSGLTRTTHGVLHSPAGRLLAESLSYRDHLRTRPAWRSVTTPSCLQRARRAACNMRSGPHRAAAGPAALLPPRLAPPPRSPTLETRVRLTVCPTLRLRRPTEITLMNLSGLSAKCTSCSRHMGGQVVKARGPYISAAPAAFATSATLLIRH